MRTRIADTATALLAMFGLLAVLQGYWQVVASPALVGSYYDQHDRLRRQLVRPGAIKARDGEPILSPVRANGKWTYRYERPRAFCHLTGYDDNSGLQHAMEDILFGKGHYADWRAKITDAIPRGCDVDLTIDPSLQEETWRLWANSSGCALVIRVSDAAILACTSAPDYDPVALASEPTMGEITETDPDEPLKFRPIQRLYQPGWAMAWVTAAEALEAGGEAGQALECDGAWRCGRKLYRCTSSHGRISLGEALQEGCRIAIQKTAQAAGAQRYRDFLKRIHLLDSASVYLRGETGRMPDFFNWRALENLAEAAIGEGAAALPPMSVARFFLSVARDGEVVQPYLVARIRSPSGRVYMEGSAKPLGQAFSQRVARQLCSLMAESARHLCHDVEPDEEVGAVAWLVKGASHVPSGEAWFVAVYPWSQPALLVLCVVERAGTADDAVHRGLSILNYARLLRLE